MDEMFIEVMFGGIPVEMKVDCSRETPVMTVEFIARTPDVLEVEDREDSSAIFCVVKPHQIDRLIESLQTLKHEYLRMEAMMGRSNG